MKQLGICFDVGLNITVEQCYNYGKIQSKYAAGIAEPFGTANIYNCCNFAEIIGNTHSAGICSEMNYKSFIYNCINFGDITLKECSGYNGGIASTANIAFNCYNVGNVIHQDMNTNPGSLSGGIVGMGKNIENCFNSGNINSSAYAAGIAGNCTDIENCYNIGEIQSSVVAGGIVGATSNVTRCYNKGNVISNSNAPTGGISGWLTKGVECYNTGNVKNNEIKTLGEIAQAREEMTLENCYFLQKETNAPANGATPKSKEEMDEIMDMQKFVDLLNQKVQEYNSNSENTIKLKSWKLENGNPVFVE